MKQEFITLHIISSRGIIIDSTDLFDNDFSSSEPQGGIFLNKEMRFLIWKDNKNLMLRH